MKKGIFPPISLAVLGSIMMIGGASIMTSEGKFPLVVLMVGAVVCMLASLLEARRRDKQRLVGEQNNDKK